MVYQREKYSEYRNKKNLHVHQAIEKKNLHVNMNTLTNQSIIDTQITREWRVMLNNF